MRIGWLGLGAMGGPMAACLARAGHQVHGYDIAPQRAAALAADGVHAAGSIPAAVAGAGLAAIMVATPDQLDQVLFGPDGAAAALPAAAIVLIMATVGPAAVEEAAARLSQSGVTVLDAPVSGGVTRAAAGDLLIMVSGPADAVHRAQPVLDALARAAPVVGPAAGDGQRMKLVNQLLCGVHIAAAAEALAFAEALGQSLLRLRGRFKAPPSLVACRSFLAPRSSVQSAPRPLRRIFVKDMGLVGAAADDAGAATPLARAAARLYQSGHDQGLGRLDDAALIEVLRAGRTV